MKLGILICTYNRPECLNQCLASLKRSSIPDGTLILIVDDCSQDAETKKLISDSGYIVINKDKNSGICKSLIIGFDFLISSRCDTVMNLDSDAIVRNDFIEQILALPDSKTIKTGFHSTTINANGTNRHVISKRGDTWNEKKSAGGINMCFASGSYKKIKETIEHADKNNLNWDHQVCLKLGGVVSVNTSVIQHIGVESTMGHYETPDVADSFKSMCLKNVTLICVDDNQDRAQSAINSCTKDIEFGAVKAITGLKLGSKEAYSNFMIREIYKYVETDYMLIVQHDGYVKNWKAWTDEYLQYDYIGAPWWYLDGMAVGNGGFSLRSKKLMQEVAELGLERLHPEDDVICRLARRKLEAKGFKFAPIELAKRFSFEGYKQPGVWDGQFGFHGPRAFYAPPNPNMQGFIINQFHGVGDIIFLVPLIRKWRTAGHDIIWPIGEEFLEIKKHFQDIQFIGKQSFPINYESRVEYLQPWRYGRYRVKPLRWNRANDISDAMVTKYSMCGEDFMMWRDLYWQRDTDAENRLAARFPKSYELHCTIFGTDTGAGTATRCGQQTRRVGSSGLPVVEMEYLPGFTLLDWAKVIENAEVIHAVSSSTFYLFEILNLKAEVINLYSRNNGMDDFKYIEKLMTKKYKLHL